MTDSRHALSRWKQIGIAALFIVGCELVGIVGAATTVTGDSSWYETLAKPPFNPPSWLFGPVWTALYALMGVAAFLVWRARREAAGTERQDASRALTLFVVQLVLNGIWTPIFFGAESIVGGAVVIVTLLVVLALTVRAFFGVSRTAGWLLVPYLLWVAFATALNLSIWWLN
ncbi:MAG: TspO/MBR family protein [Rhodothermales bacterium]